MKAATLVVALFVASAHGFGSLPAALQRLRGGKPPRMAVTADAIGIVVDAEIEPERIDEFLKVIEEDVAGSRKEEGCLRFDVLRASETRFFFYEAYVDAAAVDMHKAQPHFKLWSDFKASGGVKSSVSTKGSFAEWGFQG